jgi:histone arginine demethylase JMJD6
MRQPVKWTSRRETAQLPAIARREGLGWNVFKQLLPDSLMKYGCQIVKAEVNSKPDVAITISDILSALSSGQPRVYLRDLTLASWRPELLQLVPPSIAELDWLKILPEKVRPKWTWLMIGTRGTETRLHIDTIYSAAWNLLVTGQKHWRFYPPTWSLNQGYLPALPQALAETSEDECFAVTQLPGDLIYTPTGWAHEVFNAEGSISLTGNYINGSNIKPASELLLAAGQPALAELLSRVVHRIENLQDPGRKAF